MEFKKGHYHDGIYVKKNNLVLALVETSGRAWARSSSATWAACTGAPAPLRALWRRGPHSLRVGTHELQVLLRAPHAAAVQGCGGGRGGEHPPPRGRSQTNKQKGSSRVRGNGPAGLLFENVNAAADARPLAHHRSLGQLLRVVHEIRLGAHA